jgi:hypothetical protein
MASRADPDLRGGECTLANTEDAACHLTRPGLISEGAEDRSIEESAVLAIT